MAKNDNAVRSLEETAARASMMIAEYILINSETDTQKNMAKQIRSGDKIMDYRIAGDCTGNLKFILDVNDVTYIENQNPRRIFIRRKDKKKVWKLNREALKNKGMYFQEVPIDKLEDAIANIPQFIDKRVFCLHGMSKYFIEMLKRNCGNISSGLILGIDSWINEDDRAIYNLSIHAPAVYNPDPAKKDFCKAYLQTCIEMYGKNYNARIAEIECRMAEELGMLSHNAFRQDVHYITDAYNPDKIVEFKPDGFNLLHREIENKKLHIVLQDEVSCYDPDYEEKLSLALKDIKNRVLLESPNEMQAHLTDCKGGLVESMKRKMEVYRSCIEERDLLNITDRFVKEHMPEGLAEFEEIFEKYTELCGQALEAAFAEKESDIFTKEEVAAFQNELDNRKVNLDDYRGLEEAIVTNAFEIHPAKAKEIKRDDVSR